MKLVSPVRLGIMFAALALAGCGGSAAPASSAPPPAASAAASAKPAASAAASAKPAASVAASAKPAASGAAAGGASAKPTLPSACPAPSPAASAAAKPAASAGAAPAASAAAKPAAKPSFSTPAGILGEAAPGPYTETGRATLTGGQAAKVLVGAVHYETNTFVVKAGDKVSLDVTNCDTFAHNFFSPSLKVDPAVDIPGAANLVNVSFTAPTTPGTYMFWCSIQPVGALTHAERGMTGELIVQ